MKHNFKINLCKNITKSSICTRIRLQSEDFYKTVNIKSHYPGPLPPTVGYFRGSGEGDWFLSQYSLLKCICLVFHVENGQNEYILIIFSFKNIVLIFNDFNLKLLFPFIYLSLNGSCKLVIYLDVVYVTASYFGRKKHMFYSKVQESTAVLDNLNI